MPHPDGELHAPSVIRFHDLQHRVRDWPVLAQPPARNGAWAWIAANHRYNGLMWREEERTQRRDASVDAIAAGKALIDRYNQKRRAAAESLDEALLAGLSGIERMHGARLSSETPGAMIDRLSTLSLDIHHMRMQAERAEMDADHVRTCKTHFERLLAQRHDLAFCLDALLTDARAGTAYFKVYRQFALYDEAVLRQQQRQQQPR